MSLALIRLLFDLFPQPALTAEGMALPGFAFCHRLSDQPGMAAGSS
jgi:hypothetical protein